MSRNKKFNNKRNGQSNGRPYNGKDRQGKDKNKDYDKESDLVVDRPVNNDPNWYFTDAALADQVSQLAFQNLAGYPLYANGNNYNIPNVVRILFNPCPGVTNSADYNNTALLKMAGINLSGYRVFSKLSAYTGRVATYGPQDVSIMILAMGEIISAAEWIRRCFGIANAYSMRNRSYPREVLDWGCLVDEDDFFKNFANYRTRFNGLITMINQLPIPKGIAYFDKCASMYEKVFLDAESSMAQTIIPGMYSTWYLEEGTDPRGSVLKTQPWMADENNIYVPSATHKTMADYLDKLDAMIGKLLNSSTLQTVYTDLLNLSVKVGQEFWKLNYLMDGYLVVPEYSQNFMLQCHNATITGFPGAAPTEITTPHVTANNDVVCNVTKNALYYNPGFFTLLQADNGLFRTGTSVVLDMLNDHPDVVDRVEVTRYTSLAVGLKFNVGTGTNNAICDTVLPDHYCVSVGFKVQDAAEQPNVNDMNGTIISPTRYGKFSSLLSQIDWAPRIYEWNGNASSPAMTGNYMGDLNFYTVIDGDYLRKLHQFMALGLYDLRSGKK